MAGQLFSGCKKTGKMQKAGSSNCFFLAHAVHARGSDGHQNVLWSISCSHVVREQVKKRNARCLPKSKQNKLQTQRQPKQTQQRKTPRKLRETLRFQKIQSSQRLVLLHDDIELFAAALDPEGSKRILEETHFIPL